MIRIPNVAARGIVRRYERNGLYGIEEVLSQIGPHLVDYDGDMMDMSSERYVVFNHSLACVACGVEGKFFAKERNAKRVKKSDGDVWVPAQGQTWHFNLYGIRHHDNVVVMMTKDHIIPRSRGGADEPDNYQTMCQPCNERKGNRLPGEIQAPVPHRPKKHEPKVKTVSPFTRFEIVDRGQMIAHIVREEKALETFLNLRKNGRPAAELVRIDMVPVRTTVEVPEGEPESLFYSDSELNALRGQLREGHALAASVAEARGYELDPRIAEAMAKTV